MPSARATSLVVASAAILGFTAGAVGFAAADAAWAQGAAPTRPSESTPPQAQPNTQQPSQTLPPAEAKPEAKPDVPLDQPLSKHLGQTGGVIKPPPTASPSVIAPPNPKLDNEMVIKPPKQVPPAASPPPAQK